LTAVITSARLAEQCEAGSEVISFLAKKVRLPALQSEARQASA
tara:strand:+ start:114 stop:242 length:129 start_codon:yes stop_codon:yes gene_type:complete